MNDRERGNLLTNQGVAERLTPRQLQCLALVAQLLTSKEIAKRLGISKPMVDQHIATAVETLGVGSRREAAALVFQDPMIESGVDPVRVTPSPSDQQDEPTTSPAAPWHRRLRWPVATAESPRNDLSVASTVAWIVIIAVAALVVVGLTLSIANGLGTAFPPSPSSSHP